MEALRQERLWEVQAVAFPCLREITQTTELQPFPHLSPRHPACSIYTELILVLALGRKGCETRLDKPTGGSRSRMALNH